ncbi:MAG TPA: hypothetical protein P5092_08765 [Ruminococcus sp.]|nr:hypothetical protein [Ruminococcus sp.]
MKNPMNENNINTELFEAIDENEVNGGLLAITIDPVHVQPISSYYKGSIVIGCIRYSINCKPVSTFSKDCFRITLSK